jgi:hypothetical protein
MKLTYFNRKKKLGDISARIQQSLSKSLENFPHKQMFHIH